MVEPSEDALAQFIEFTGYPDRTIATIFIKGNENSWEKAVEAYFTDPNPSRFQHANQSYDESSWSTDRAGESNNGNLVPYQMEDPVQMQVGGTAPSRPPSRISQIGNQGTQGFIGPVYEGEEEAIKRSLMQQETGVIGSGGHEYVPDPPPEKRQRLESSPAFMKPLTRKDFLPSLITILHSIPRCRQVLLRLGHVLPDYGFNPRWWEGESVEVAHIMDSADHDTSLDGFEILYEVQRLMAFLDQSERAYGSVAALTNLPAMKKIQEEAWQTKPMFAQFMEAWEIAAKESVAEMEPYKLFSSRVTGPEGQQSWDLETKWYFRVTADVSSKFEGQDANLYDALDREFWSGSSTQQDRWLRNVSPIIVFHIQPPMLRQQYKRLSVPLSWDPDMYLLSNQELVKDVRSQMDECLKRKENIEDKLFKLRKFSTAQFRHAEGKEFLNAAINSLNQHNLLEREQIPGSPNPLTINPKIAAQLEMIADKLSSQMKTLEGAILDLKARYYKYAGSIAPSMSPAQPLEGKFQLRGVATSPTARTSITFLKESNDRLPETESMEAEGLDTTQQWWKAKYDFTGGSPMIKQEKAYESEVLEAASKEGEEVLLVYAVDDLLTTGGLIPLPRSLQLFVEADNRAFHDELDLNPTEILIGESPDDVEMMPFGNEARVPKPMETQSAIMLDPTQVETNDVSNELQQMEQVQDSSSGSLRASGWNPQPNGKVDSDMNMEP